MILIGERINELTPQPATPDAVAATCAEIVKIAEWQDAVGITLPSVIKNKVVLSAAARSASGRSPPSINNP